MKKLFIFIIFLISFDISTQSLRWANDGNSYYGIESGEIIRYLLPANTKTTFISKADVTPAGQAKSLPIRHFIISRDQSKVLIFTNTRKVCRLETRGDYWVLDLKTKSLKQIGKGRPESSLMFAKFSPDGQMAAYVSEQNVYAENLVTGENHSPKTAIENLSTALSIGSMRKSSRVGMDFNGVLTVSILPTGKSMPIRSATFT